MVSRLDHNPQVSEDGTEFEISFPEFGLHNIYKSGVGSYWPVSNFMTLTAFMSIKATNFFTNIVGLFGHNLFIVQSILKIKPDYHSFITPNTLWPSLKSFSKLESFYRSTAVIKQAIIMKDSNIILAENHTKLINLDEKTRKSVVFPSEIINKFEKFHEKPHIYFPDVSDYLKMDDNKSELYLESLVNEKVENLVVFKMEEILFETDEDWNDHVSNSVYLRMCCNCLSRARVKNNIFRELCDAHPIILQMTNCYLKECKSQDTITILCILNKCYPTILDFKLFKKTSTGKHQLIFISQLMFKETSSKL